MRAALRRAVCVTVAAILLFSLLALPVGAIEAPDLSHADAVYLYNPENDRVLVSKNINKIIYPASTVKVMTGLVAAEALAGRYGETVTVTQEMVDAASSFRMYLTPGEKVTVEQMLYAGLCAGYNDACVVLAYLVSGSVDAFVARMNTRATELGMTNTVYTNPTGIHNDRMVTTVEDIVKLALTAMENEAYMKIVSTPKYTMAANNQAPARTFYNRNAMIDRHLTSRYYHGYVTGMNAGMTDEGGYCIVASAADEDQGLRYLAVVMGAGADPEEQGGTVYSYQIANALLDYAIDGFGMVTIVGRETVVSTAQVALSEKTSQVGLVPARDVTAYLPTDIDPAQLSYRVMLNSETVNAPIKAGDVLGFATVSYNGTLLATVDLCAAQDVEQSTFLVALDRISTYTTGRRFILICIYAVLLLLGYFVGLPYLRKRRNRKRAKFY